MQPENYCQPEKADFKGIERKTESDGDHGRILLKDLLQNTAQPLYDTVSQSGCCHKKALAVFLKTYHRVLSDFPFYYFTLETEYHIRGALKKSQVFFPAHTASAVLQADKLLSHFSAASGADFIASPHGAISLD